MLPNIAIAILILALGIFFSGILYFAVRYVKSSRDAVQQVLDSNNGYASSYYSSCSSSRDDTTLGGTQTVVLVRQE
jgi:uncharacterized membrane protein YqiK